MKSFLFSFLLLLIHDTFYFRSISTQTDQLANIEMKNSFCQTDAEGVKRKLLLFKGRNSQHNKLAKSSTKDKKPPA